MKRNQKEVCMYVIYIFIHTHMNVFKMKSWRLRSLKICHLKAEAPEKLVMWWCASKFECQRANGIDSSSCLKTWEPKVKDRRTMPESRIQSSWASCCKQVLHGLYHAHPHWREPSALLSPPISTLISSRYIFTDTPEWCLTWYLGMPWPSQVNW